MLTRLRTRNFKRFREIDIELGRAVVLIGPNNSGKTTALQALALWEIGLRRWSEKRGDGPSPVKRPGVTVNRRDLISIPVPDANLLWRDLHVRDVDYHDEEGVRKPKTENVRIEIIVDGISEGTAWSCGLEFDYANAESFYCRPLRLNENGAASRMPVPPEASLARVAFLPPMSGLAAVEPKWELGRVNVLIGEGQTAQVLRNLCYQIYSQDDHTDWNSLTEQLLQLFGVELLAPQYITQRGEITMAYRDRESRVTLDLSSAGRGLQQTLLLLGHLYANPRTVLLLDEPDAHLEVLRQRQTYKLLTDVALQRGSQIIAASHSEVVLNEAVDRDTVIAFVGRPHRIDRTSAQVRKALRDIGFDQYSQAELTGWVLYLEDATDFAILQAFAQVLNHPASACLERPFVHYVATNLPQRAREHFHGLREAKPDLVGVAVFDRLDKELQPTPALRERAWRRREIENYFCTERVLTAYAAAIPTDDLFGSALQERRLDAMRESVREVREALQTLGKPDAWSPDVKATDDFLDPLFKKFFGKLGMPLAFRKSEYHHLARFLSADDIDPEVAEVLDEIAAVANAARPTSG